MSANRSSRKAVWFTYIYLTLLILELGMVGYDGLFNDPTHNKWIRFSILLGGTVGVFAWIEQVWLHAKWLWRSIFVLACVWFLIYAPLMSYLQVAKIEDFDFLVVLPGYVIFYAFHIPMVYMLYSCGFRHVRVGEPNVSST